MRSRFLAYAALLGLLCTEAPALGQSDITSTIIGLKRAALDRWGKGDPSGYLEIYAPDVVYFDPTLERRLDGREAIARYIELARGKTALAGRLSSPTGHIHTGRDPLLHARF